MYARSVLGACMCVCSECAWKVYVCMLGVCMCVCSECAWSVYVCLLGVCLECVCVYAWGVLGVCMCPDSHAVPIPSLLLSPSRAFHTYPNALYTPFIIQKPAVFQGPVAQAAIPLAVSISLYIYTQPSSLQVLIGRQEGR